MLGADPLKGTDDDIGEDHPQKQGVPGRAHQDHGGGQGKVQKVKKGKYIFPNDLPFGFGFHAGIPIVQAFPDPLFHLLGGKALLRVRVEPLGGAGTVCVLPGAGLIPFSCFSFRQNSSLLEKQNFFGKVIV